MNKVLPREGPVNSLREINHLECATSISEYGT